MTNFKKRRSSRRRRRRRKAIRKRLQQLEAKNNILDVLPSHVITEITLKLPIKSISDCTRVCKIWRSIIVQPYFTDLYLSRSSPSVNDMIMCWNEKSGIFTLVPTESPTIIACEDLVFYTPKHFPVYPDSENICLQHLSANGLICLEEKKKSRIYIYNPVIKEYVVVPRPNDSSKEKAINELCFGFCPKTSQYKILRIVKTLGVDKPMRCEIYTLGTPAWREVSNAPTRLINYLWDFEVCSVGGDIYFLVERDYEPILLSFNLEREGFVSIFPPPIGDSERMQCLGVLDNCFDVTCAPTNYAFLDIWVMQESMREDSWARKWTIVAPLNYGAFDDFLEPISVDFNFLEPIKLSSDGRIIMLDFVDKIYWYDPEESCFTEYENPDKMWVTCAYSLTFVSPKEIMGLFMSE